MFFDEDKELNIDDFLSNAYDEKLAEEEDKIPEEAAPGCENDQEQPKQATPPKEKERDQKGRFAAKQAPEAIDQNTPVETQPVNDQAQPSAAPARWSAEDKANFNALPPDAQKLVLKREQDIERYLTQKTQEIAHIKREYDSLEQVIGPRRQEMAKMGYTAATALNELLTLNDMASKDPHRFLSWYVREHNIDLGQFQQQEEIRPSIDPLLPTVVQRVGQLEQEINHYKRAQDQALQSQSQSLIEKFASNPENKYFEDVRVEMGRLVEAGLVDPMDLEGAYNRACWSIPEIRQRILDEQRQADEAKRIAAAQEAAAKARKAQGVTIKPKSVVPVKGAPISVDDTLSRTYDSLHGGM